MEIEFIVFGSELLALLVRSSYCQDRIQDGGMWNGGAGVTSSQSCIGDYAGSVLSLGV